MKMTLPHRIPIVYSLIFLLLLQTSLDAKKTKRRICPIGFQIAYTKTKGDPICYRLKGPERVTDTFKDCSGNLYTAKLYDDMNITNHTDLVLWTEYKSAYPGGPFVDTSFTTTAGSLLDTSFDVTNARISIDEMLCVVKDPVGNYTVERCEREYHRYCFIEPYPEEPMSNEGCERLNDSVRFWSPTSICLTVATGVSGGAVRATWVQSNDLCDKRHGEVLYSGWRYSNSPLFKNGSVLHTIYPLRMNYDSSHNTTVRNGIDFVREPASVIKSTSDDALYGALKNGMADFVNSSYIFYDVICEKDVEVEGLQLTIKTDNQNELTLTVNNTVSINSIACFTDSNTYYPTPVTISFNNYDNGEVTYVIKPESDGNYWCFTNDSKRFQVSKSNKELWIREKETLHYTYAVKLHFEKEYSFENLDTVSKIWEWKLKDYIYYSTLYYNSSGGIDLEEDNFEDKLKEFKENHPELKSRLKDVLYDMKIKEIYMDGKTALVHFQLSSNMQPVRPGWWSGMRIIYMKPIYFCSLPAKDSTTSEKQVFSLGETINTNCESHSCIGTFNDGVQILTQSDELCRNATRPSLRNAEVTVIIPTIATLAPYKNPELFRSDSEDSSEENSENIIVEATTELVPNLTVPPLTIPANTTEMESTTDTEWSTSKIVTSTMPPVTIVTSETVMTASPTFPITPSPTTETPTTTLPPEEQLQQVMDQLGDLLNTPDVSLDAISGSFDQIDDFLSVNRSTDIPRQLLHLLDDIGVKLDLNGSGEAQTIRNNVALLVASAEPGMPVKGLRIAANNEDVFTPDAFAILRDEINSTHLTSGSSEAVVKLPESVTNSTRRISFVVFRNDRAFQTNSSYMAVNSRVLSIKVENITQFPTGETVDIHFNPLMGDPDRGQQRTCAFWDFDIGPSGDWSTAGCTFIPASTPDTLDTCRCEHLTHFAEILVSRTVFSELDEQVLEILSIVGCSLSLFGLVMIGLTAVLFRSWRRDFSNKIWLQLCIAIFILIVCFLIAVYARFTTYNVGCMMTGILLHYSVLASFCWMLVAAVLSYRRLVMVFTRDASHKLLRASAFAWGAPFAVVGILLSVDPRSYAGQFEDMTPTGAFCYPSGLGLWIAVYAPIGVMLLANWTLFILIVRSVFASRRIPRHGDSNEAIRCASVSCLLVFLFGLPWVFGLFASNVVAAYFFALTATFQGFVLFIFFVVGNKKTRDLWLNKLKIKQARKVPVTSSTYTNRSTGPGWRGGASGTVEAKVSKPRSLATSDDSRFS